MVSPKKLAQMHPSSSMHHHQHQPNHHHHHHHHHYNSSNNHESNNGSECETAIPLGVTNSPIVKRKKLGYVGAKNNKIHQGHRSGGEKITRMTLVVLVVLLGVVGVVWVSGRSRMRSGPDQALFLSSMGQVIVPAKYEVPAMEDDDPSRGVLLMAVEKESRNDRIRSLLSSSPQWSLVTAIKQERSDMVEHRCKASVWKVYQQLTNNDDLQLEIWKYCQMASAAPTTAQAMAFIDHQSPLLVSWKQLLSVYNDTQSSLAVLSHERTNSLHSSLLLLSHSHRQSVAEQLLQTVVETPLHVLKADPLVLPRALQGALESAGQVQYLQQQCHAADADYRYPCDIRVPAQAKDAVEALLVMSTRHRQLPRLSLPPLHEVAKPYKHHYNAQLPATDQDSWPFIATIREVKSNSNGKMNAKTNTDNFYQILSGMDCLPSDRYCSACLRNKNKGASCSSCQKECKCYCKHLCHLDVPQKRISKRLQVTPPLYRKDSSRAVPRIIHQTYYDHVTPDKYPNMSRLTQTWKTAGWEYHFYLDDDIAHVLQTHFPPEVKEAFDALQPGAFKADLFRYCVLLIYGGVYADMDVLLEANPEQIVSPDIGFMTPQDEPGKATGHRMCLWNGFIAVAPGHSYLAQVIETVVNNIRNRFTSVDMDHTLCPDPDFSVSHSYDMLFTAGPCILGASLNRILQNHPQQGFEPGEIIVPDQVLAKHYIPDRTIILSQKKKDMGAHRFTFDEKNLLVAATDMPDYDDRKTVDGAPAHYSGVHIRKEGIYGLKNLYSDRNIANEEIRIEITPHKILHD